MHNAFKVLQYKGFLHDEGINTLEAVQKFYEAISENTRKSGYVEKDLLDFCPPGQSSVGGYQPVVNIMFYNSKTGSEAFHAVAVKNYLNDGKTLTLTLIDSTTTSGERTVKDRIHQFRAVF